jgi:hypothetical protein
MYRTDWFRAQIQVRDGRITSLEPSNIPARRVRQIERDGPERRREFAQDVAADAVPEQAEIQPDEKYFAADA